VIADPASRADRPCDVRAHRRPARSISPAAVAREPATAGCRLARRNRSGSLPECHRVGRCSARRARMTGRGITTAGRLDWVLRSESSMPSIKPSEVVFCNCHRRKLPRKRDVVPPSSTARAAQVVRSVIAASVQRARSIAPSSPAKPMRITRCAVTGSPTTDPRPTMRASRGAGPGRSPGPGRAAG
jgi:hypothetical protein